MEELLKSLIDIQQRLEAPKNQFNSFGKYNYRSLEDIQAALKPLLKEHSCGIRFQDEIVEFCGRTFLKTTLFFFNSKGESISTTALAEHASEKSGMDKAQISGSSSSYARKYALNAMFAIDDTKDPDTDSYHNQSTQQSKVPFPKKDRYEGIKKSLSEVFDIDSLMNLYNSHKAEVQSNEQIKELFSQRKKQLLQTNFC